jgi:hypothetical protein
MVTLVGFEVEELKTYELPHLDFYALYLVLVGRTRLEDTITTIQIP